ncbi:MAG: hypothetical protein IOC39_27010 [Burkholderia sp.]|uniref:hypothetical protein n=1 Tax=Burkholderia sp. TaxID=36773 RepID=UPI00258A1EDF|nr:hypothetical protein [Burkholderia sp.]MCA3780980.1 hypothetical protein [Burkholderia sp.]MCA3786658.1 hypothetical protein [Burkholderia sp.]MCA3796906.1 hypothetical protein [Burkholderia sp.]MCA3805670.1 hypothetical protein [Burkholderia sp.]MCA3813173.1 hypothetical protein [Burkholderia sp.]
MKHRRARDARRRRQGDEAGHETKKNDSRTAISIAAALIDARGKPVFFSQTGVLDTP